MQAKELTLEPLLVGHKQYLVPPYQRTYAWQHDQLDRLWSDVPALADALHDGTTSGVALSMSRLELRSSFPIERRAAGGLDAAIEAHTWFLAQFLTMNGTS